MAPAGSTPAEGTEDTNNGKVMPAAAGNWQMPELAMQYVRGIVREARKAQVGGTAAGCNGTTAVPAGRYYEE